MPITALILAAGEGTRMKSAHPKVMHEALGKPLVWWPIHAARQAGAERIIVVVGSGSEEVRAFLSSEADIEVVEQTERLGTGHACRVALESVKPIEGTVVVLYGDSPLMRAETISKLVERVQDCGEMACVLTMTPPDTTGYGRITFDDKGNVTAIIEHKDCTPEQREELLECNSGIYAFDAKALYDHIDEITNNNAAHEYYLTDMIALMHASGLSVSSVHIDDYSELLGVNSRIQLAEATKILQMRINNELMASGVTMIDPNLVWVGPEATIGRDTIILPMTMLMGDTHIGEACTVGPNTRLTNTSVGNECTIDETVALDACIENGVSCGPRAYLRPGAHLLDNSKVGTHVEIKKSTVGIASKVPHLSYIGDTTIGEHVNIGAGTITCNYDGVHKHATIIGNNVFVGSDTMLVAPVSIGDNAVIGASSCITKDVPADALGIERSAQRIVEGYAQIRNERLHEGRE